MSGKPQTVHNLYSQEAEEAVLGAVMISPDVFLSISSFLNGTDFFLLRHQYVWEAFQRISDRNERVDFVTVNEELRGQGRLDEVGGPAFLLQLTNTTPTSINAEVYGRLVQRAAWRRRMCQAADDIRKLAMDESVEVESAYLRGMQLYDAIKVEDRRQYLPGALSIIRYDETLQDLMERNRRGEMVGYPLPTHWHKLSEAVPVLYPGDFVVVSGMPGSGKSAMLETWAEHYAGLGLNVHYVHTEMSTDQILHRRMARHSGVPYHALASGDFSAYYSRILDADVKKIEGFTKHIAYHWMPDPAFQHLAQEMRLSAMRGTTLFFIDHFQDVMPPEGRNEVRAFEEMCVWFAAFAEFRKVVIVMASQENEQGKTKWTKKLVEKAVVWMSIKRDRLQNEYAYQHDGVEYRHNPGEDSPEAYITIKKARFGRKGKLKMLYHGPSFAWMDMARIQRPYVAGKVVSIEELKSRQRTGSEVAQ